MGHFDPARLTPQLKRLRTIAITLAIGAYLLSFFHLYPVCTNINNYSPDDGPDCKFFSGFIKFERKLGAL